MKITHIAVLVISLVAVRPLAAECAPERMLRIVTQAEGPGIDPNSFAAKPKTTYRLGKKYARIEEAPDQPNKIHGLIVSNAPNNWMVNLYDRTGRHIVDPDPDGDVVVPLFLTGSFAGFPAELSDVEMGCEAAFFDSHGSPKRVLKSDSGDRIQQALGVGEWKLVLVWRESQAAPELLFVFRGDEIVVALRYLSFEEFAVPNMKMFAKPEGIVLREEPAG